LHDIGKVGVPDAILLKESKLTDEEFVTMRLHAQHGHDAIAVAEERMGTNSFLRFGREIAYTHHEKWDGTGYPQGLRGPEIPISGRLMAVADVYDALMSKRVYKPALTQEKTVEIIKKDSGTHFDPTVVDAFQEMVDEFAAIREQYRDSDEGERIDYDPREQVD
jgi:response regulator RpfG family c-di-GMP phosphodiesterase